MPGEISSYDIGRGRIADIRYHRTRAATLIVFLDPPATSTSEALASVGASEAQLRQAFESPVARRYRGQINGVAMEEVMLSGGNGGWSMVVVKFIPAP